jgi:hypothetical protein
VRRRQGLVLLVVALAFGSAPTAEGGARKPGKPPPRGEWKVKPVGQSGFRFNRGRPGKTVVYKKVRGCTTWTIYVTVSGPDDADGNPTTIEQPQKWRKCPGFNGGNGVGQPFRVADSFPDGEEISEVFAPSPVMSFDSLTPTPLAYTQRAMYWWVDPALQPSAAGGATVTAPVEIVENGVRTRRQVGYAVLRPVKLTFDPGISGSGAQQCEGADVTRAYDPAEAHNEQSTSCWHVYYVSSRNQPGQRYEAFARVEWEVLSVVIDGRVQDGPFENRESVSETYPVEVREIQAIPVCKGSSAEECPFT